MILREREGYFCCLKPFINTGNIAHFNYNVLFLYKSISVHDFRSCDLNFIVEVGFLKVIDSHIHHKSGSLMFQKWC